MENYSIKNIYKNIINCLLNSNYFIRIGNQGLNIFQLHLYHFISKQLIFSSSGSALFYP